MRAQAIQTIALGAVTAVAQNHSSGKCVPDTFHPPFILGVDYLSVTAEEVTNFTALSMGPVFAEALLAEYTVSFCNVTVSYTHPGWDDNIKVDVWLPLNDNWNGRVWASGGANLAATVGALTYTQAVSRGFATIGTNAGHRIDDSANASWALSTPGNLDLPLMVDWGFRSLGELTPIGKSAVSDYYGKEPEYSYFAGCSGGGRQALMVAERYPDAYDGVLVGAPAISLEQLVPAAYWPQQVIQNLNYIIPPCEQDQFTKEAVLACDAADGLEDGIISAPWACNFTAASVIGKPYACNDTTGTLTRKGAQIVQAIWDGPDDPNSSFSWPGLAFDAPLDNYARTQCSANGTCSLQPETLWGTWIRYILARDPAYDIAAMTDAEFYDFIAMSRRDWAASIGAADPDLTRLHAAGAKLMMVHGMADNAIPVQQSRHFYHAVVRADVDALEYTRYFEAPGVGHCSGGVGPQPDGAFDVLRAWVERGEEPALQAVGKDGEEKRPLCAYPKRQVYNRDGEFACEGSWDEVGPASVSMLNNSVVMCAQ